MAEDIMINSQILDDTEVRLRLIEAAAQLPAVRVKTGDKEAAATAHAIADSWYNCFVNGEKTKKSQPAKATK